jgi:putative hydrolase of the HAD superfamily
VTAYHDTKFREWKPFAGVRELFAELKQVGMRLGVITHGLAVKQAEKLIRLELLPYLDPQAIFISDAIGISKPNPKLYQLALRRMELSPAEVMYVGDHPAHDIGPPKSLGMITVWARAMAKHELAEVEPDHVIEGFADLRRLLIERYGVRLEPA